MAFRVVSVNEIREVLRVWLGVARLPAPGYRTIAAHCGMDRKTVRRYVEAAQAAGLRRSDNVEAVDDGLIGAVADAVRPVRPDGHGAAWELLMGFEDQITAWVAGEGGQRPLTITKIETLLARQGCVVPYRTLNRFAGERCGFGRKDTTVPGGRWGSRGGMPDRFRLSRNAHRRRRWAAPQGARVDLHHRLQSAHVRVAVLFADPGGGDRRMPGGVGVLRRSLQGLDSGQSEAGDRRRPMRSTPGSLRGGSITPAMPGSSPTRPGPGALSPLNRLITILNRPRHAVLLGFLTVAD